jgi:SAM-dependent methyltransferase
MGRDDGRNAMNPNKALWEKGDFTRIAASMRESGEALVGTLGIEKGLKVLDLGSGDGTTALPAAKLGAEVLGVDIARNLVEPETGVRGSTVSRTYDSKKATRPIWPECRTKGSIWSSVFSGPCSPPNRSMSPRRWCE